jgi:hypothetical protein
MLLAGVAAAGLAMTATTAEAATAYTTAANNNVLGAGFQGWLGASWYLIAGGLTTIDVYKVGVEAGASNSFTLGTTTYGPYSGNDGLSVLLGGSVPVLQLASANILPGLVPFQFTTTFGGGGTVTNAANPLPLVTPNFFSSVFTCPAGPLTGCTFTGGSLAGSGNTLLLALDDGGGGRVPDDNHDDLVMIIRISNGSFTAVPEPATLGLLGAGLLGLGFAARRRRKA